MKGIILFNGPPRSGKDTSASLLKVFLEMEGYKVDIDNFVKPIKDIVGLFKDNNQDKTKKDDKGNTLRDYWCGVGDILAPYNVCANRVAGLIEQSKADYFIVTDLGYEREIERISQLKIPYHIVHVSREDCDFSNDTREYVEDSDPQGRGRSGVQRNGGIKAITHSIVNLGIPDDLTLEVKALMNGILDRKPQHSISCRISDDGGLEGCLVPVEPTIKGKRGRKPGNTQPTSKSMQKALDEYGKKIKELRKSKPKVVKEGTTAMGTEVIDSNSSITFEGIPIEVIEDLDNWVYYDNYLVEQIINDIIEQHNLGNHQDGFIKTYHGEHVNGTLKDHIADKAIALVGVHTAPSNRKPYPVITIQPLVDGWLYRVCGTEYTLVVKHPNTEH